MHTPKFCHYKLELISPSFDSPLADLVIELDHLRKLELRSSTHPQVFFQLKQIFHILESIGSARIEGNNTTVAEYIETKLETEEAIPENIREIQNIEYAMSFIEKHITDYPLNKMFLSELHRIIVNKLSLPPKGEGDPNPGAYRKFDVKITKSSHIPPHHSTIDQYMEELFAFINASNAPKYDLLKVAIAHHRFVWIHPFANGNGRTIRLLTYAMLIKLGFNVNVGRIINPTAIFCSNRENYYYNLSLADKGGPKEILSWCEYALKGLKEAITKIDNLLNYNYLKKEILLPAVSHSLSKKYIIEIEYKILKRVIERQVIQNNDLTDIFGGKQKQEISRQIKKLIEKKLIVPEEGAKRKYIINFNGNYLLRSVIKSLGDKGFLPDQVNL